MAANISSGSFFVVTPDAMGGSGSNFGIGCGSGGATSLASDVVGIGIGGTTIAGSTGACAPNGLTMPIESISFIDGDAGDVVSVSGSNGKFCGTVLSIKEHEEVMGAKECNQW
jgi:hypothetical protein